MSTNVSRPTSIHTTTNMCDLCAFTPAKLQEFVNNIISNTFIQNVALLYDSPIDNIISIRHYPFNAPMVSFNYPSEQNIAKAQAVVVNTVTISVENALMSPLMPYLMDIGGIWIGRHFNSFLDYSPYTEIELFLPFCGFVKLDTDLVMNKYVSVKYGVDFNTGICTAFIQVSTDSTQADAVLLMTKEFKIGVDIPICGGGLNEVAKSMVASGLKTAVGVAGAVAGGVVGGVGGAVIGVSAVSGILNSTIDTAFNQKLQTVKGEVSSGYNSFYSPANMYLIISRPNVQYPTNYNHLYGRPSMETETLAYLTGYTKVEKCDITGTYFESALTEEKNEIENLLKDGVLLDNP